MEGGRETNPCLCVPLFNSCPSSASLFSFCSIIDFVSFLIQSHSYSVHEQKSGEGQLVGGFGWSIQVSHSSLNCRKNVDWPFVLLLL